MTPVQPVTQDLRGFVEFIEERRPEEISVPGSDRINPEAFIEGHETQGMFQKNAPSGDSEHFQEEQWKRLSSFLHWDSEPFHALQSSFFRRFPSLHFHGSVNSPRHIPRRAVLAMPSWAT